MTLDGKTLAELAKPFTAAAIKFKPQTVTKDLSKGLASFYIDARLVAERLNEVVGPENWSDEYRLLADGREMPALYYPVECRLTVCGVTKTDVGQGANTVLDDKAWKSAYSDALKRAAVKFRIGAYLYTLPNLWAPVKVGSNGKAQGFSPEGMEQLRGQYERWLKSPGNTYGAPLDHGDVAHAESDEPKPAGRPAGDTASGQPKPAGTASAPAQQGGGGTKPAGSAAQTPQPVSDFPIPDTVGPQSGEPEWRWPSGKHKGKSLVETPLEYVLWYRDNGPREDAKEKINVFLGESGVAAVDGENIPFGEAA